MKQFRILGVLVVVLAVMVVVAAIQSAPRPGELSITPTVDPRSINRVFRDWETADVQALKLDDPLDTDLTLSRDADDLWTIGEITGELDQGIATTLIDTVAYLPYTDIIGNVTSADYPTYGLDANMIWLQILIVLKDGSQHAVAVGGRVPIEGGGYYALVDGLPEVYVLNRGAIDYLGLYLRQTQAIE